MFLLSGVTGWWLVSTYPELAGLFASEEMINQVQRGKLWTEGMINVVPSSFLSLSIMTNNIVVALFAFALGAFYGLGTLYIIGLNGLMLGGIFAFTAKYGLAEELFSFVVAHGVVELSIICLGWCRRRSTWGSFGASRGTSSYRSLSRGSISGEQPSFPSAWCFSLALVSLRATSPPILLFPLVFRIGRRT